MPTYTRTPLLSSNYDYNWPGGSTLQWGVVRGLMCLARLLLLLYCYSTYRKCSVVRPLGVYGDNFCNSFCDVYSTNSLQHHARTVCLANQCTV